MEAGAASGANREIHEGDAVAKTMEEKVRGVIAEFLGKRKVGLEELKTQRKGDPLKMELAAKLRKQTATTMGWIAKELNAGVPNRVWNAEKGGMAVSAVLRLVHLLAPYPSEPWYPPPYTGGTPMPLSKSPKGIGFWYYSYRSVHLTSVFCLAVSTSAPRPGAAWASSLASPPVAWALSGLAPLWAMEILKGSPPMTWAVPLSVLLGESQRISVRSTQPWRICRSVETTCGWACAFRTEIIAQWFGSISLSRRALPEILPR